jgi:hypothetical protein
MIEYTGGVGEIALVERKTGIWRPGIRLLGAINEGKGE